MSARISPYRPPRLDSVPVARSARTLSRNSIGSNSNSNNNNNINTSRSSSGSYASQNNSGNNNSYHQRLHTSQSERRGTASLTREPFTPPEVILQRHYSEPCPSPLPLRYSHHNQYGRGSASATGARDSHGGGDGGDGGGGGGGGSKPFMQLFSSRMLRLKLMQNQRRQTMPFMTGQG
ncbi:hypothetical protein PoB_004958800 [Plakobranchus ocellatus]|uniref:Uncharacterized protein n=1 Tax=Plakobranchus ocellatus TaxID=259542 RepID=A0AAV4BW95_9GAST|nr:hypothetical protein PoB_004958800 [Plakobranchus ocellatus]